MRPMKIASWHSRTSTRRRAILVSISRRRTGTNSASIRNRIAKRVRGKPWRQKSAWALQKKRRARLPKRADADGKKRTTEPAALRVETVLVEPSQYGLPALAQAFDRRPRDRTAVPLVEYGVNLLMLDVEAL